MRLSGIKLAGFKSFVDPTSLPLSSRLTSVVGPNGCGKSNLIDAVRWVLGETSIKNLRGSESEDVIFNGSRTRKPAGRASVELTFDNSDFQVTGPYAAYAELAVKRELTRDGSSQYYLNGNKCLKRDVTDLFLGTGLGGKNQYAIIEQGMVSRMVEAKPEELRQWLEETAGISKYKERRRETESRIKQTRENLSRLQDLQTELGGRLEVLGKQAANAEKYKQYKEEERRLKAAVLLLRLVALEAEAATRGQGIDGYDAALEAARAAIADADAVREGAESTLRDATAATNDEQARAYDAEAVLARNEQNLAHARELKNLRVRELEQLEGQLFELTRRRDQEQLRAQTLTQAVAAAEQRVSEGEQAEQDAHEVLQDADAVLVEAQQRHDEFGQRAQAPLLAAEGERVRVQSLEKAQTQLDERLRRLDGEHAGLSLAPIREALAELEHELAEMSEALEAARDEVETTEAGLNEARERRNGVDAALHEARQTLQSARGRHAALEALQQAALRDDDPELGQWLRQHGLADLPRLATTLSVDAGWDSAVEQVLEHWLQAPLVGPDQLPARPDLAAPKGGAALLLGAEAADSGADDGAHLSSKVRGTPALAALLHGIYAVDDDDAFERRVATLADGESVINRAGVWRGRGWLRYPKRDGDHGGVIARGHELKQLKATLEDSAARVQSGERELAELNTRRIQLDNERRGAASRFEQLRGRQAQKLAQRQAQVVRLEQTESRQRALAQELELLRAQRETQIDELDAARERLAELEDNAARLRDERLLLAQALASAREGLQAARTALQTATQTRSQAQVQLAGQSSALTALVRSLETLAEQREALEEQRETRRSAGDALDEPIAVKAAEVEAARTALQAAREQLRQARERQTGAEAALAEAVRRHRAAEAHKDVAQEQLQNARLEFENLRARRDGAAAQFAETGFERAELTPDVGDNPDAETLPQWEDRLALVGRRIDRLGAINLAAIQELDEARSREAYLAAQHADVTQALATLETAMAQLDRETQDRFRTTFDQVNDIFKARFPQLFGGGEAYLELTGAEVGPDGEPGAPMSRGVRVMARPPGKRNSSIQLLSGGEKAMTAVALLLALFQLNPAPFCLMDEVDAPLDDANVGRFCEVVREMSQNVQFIIITHNKITMELAECLHGVTMQEPGVSRLVSVDVQQAVAMVAEPDGASGA